jgi:hypothetical protein
MALKCVCAILLALIPATARAECEAEAIQAREKIFTSGPFHYVIRNWKEASDGRKASDWTETGEAEPHKAGPMVTVFDSPYQPCIVPEVREKAVSAKCLGQVEVEGQSLTGYELKIMHMPQGYTEKLFVEPATGLTVRYERLAQPGYHSSTTTYRYDASIKFEAPKGGVYPFPARVPRQEADWMDWEHCYEVTHF